MKTRIWSIVGISVVAVGLLGCSSGDLNDTERSGVYLAVTDFDELPVTVSVTAFAFPGSNLSVGQLIITSFATNPGAPTSPLMNVEMENYELGFSRADTGTRTPQPIERRIFGTVPVNGNLTYDNLPVMTSEEFLNPPLSDLLAANGGVDKETGSEVILLNLELKFFGQTANGTRVETRVPARWNIQFVQ